jgi:fumarate hydratase subunit beta
MALKLETPYTESKIREFHVGDIVEISGKLFTARDAVHKYVFDGGKLPVSLENQILYHCGPVVVKQDGEWVVKAAGPTTSFREEPYQWKLIQDLKLKGVIGKGGMGKKTLEACKAFGCCYLHAVGGAAQVLAEKITKVHNVYMMEEFGSPEAIWEFEVKDFPVVVTMDSHGKSLHEDIFNISTESLKKLL